MWKFVWKINWAFSGQVASCPLTHPHYQGCSYFRVSSIFTTSLHFRNSPQADGSICFTSAFISAIPDDPRVCHWRNLHCSQISSVRLTFSPCQPFQADGCVCVCVCWLSQASLPGSCAAHADISSYYMSLSYVLLLLSLSSQARLHFVS